MGRWWACAVGLALGVCTVLGCGGSTIDDVRDLMRHDTPAPAPVSPPTPTPAPARPVPSPEPWPTFAPLWTVHVSLGGFQDVARMASDGAGGFVVLTTNPHDTPVGDTSGNLVLTRYDSKGRASWSRVLFVSLGLDVYGLRQQSRLSVSSAGDVFVAFQFQTMGRFQVGDGQAGQGGGFLAKLGADGGTRWVKNGTFQALAADGEGGVVVTTRDGSVIRYGADGTTRWDRMPRGSATSFTAVAVDDRGNVVAAGHDALEPARGSGVIVSLSADGSPRWMRNTHASEGWADFTGLAILRDGGILLTGTFYRAFLWGNYRLNLPCATGGTCGVIAAVLAADANGNPLWAQELEGDAIQPRVSASPEGDGVVLWTNRCQARMLRVSSSGDVRSQFEDATVPCEADLLLTREVAILDDGTVVRAGLFSGARAFSDGARFLADEADVFLQALEP